MRAVKLVVEPFKYISYLNLECTKALNEHGVLKITGIIGQKESSEYMDMAYQKTWVNVYVISEDEEIRRFFSGILTGLWIRREGQVSIQTIEIRTGSILLDIKQHIRSFQDRKLRYYEVLNSCVKPEEGNILMWDNEEKAVDQFLLQYKETDWEFVKRLASYAGTVIIAEDSLPGIKIHWGYQNTVAVEKVQADSYYMLQDYEMFERKKALGFADLRLSDMISYEINSREIYSLGETVQFEGRELVVGKIDSCLKGQELYNRYHLMTKMRGINTPFYNYRISGASLKAVVEEVEKTVVKIKIEEDENKAGYRDWWFDYATVYSTPDGTGWYCMPDIGDKVRLVFPDRNEGHAYVASSVHLGDSDGRTNPEQKSWKNRQNKEVLFTPDAIVLSNNNGMSVELSDKDGIKLISNKDIALLSNRDIRIKSHSGRVNVFAESSIMMKQGSAELQMDNEINILGGKIYMN